MATRTVFCANQQTETLHEISVASNGEIVLTCKAELPTGEKTESGVEITSPCGRFVKFPAGLTVDEIVAKLAAHKDVNVGQVSIQASHDLADLLAEEDISEQQA